jgi:hypothetical protein
LRGRATGLALAVVLSACARVEPEPVTIRVVVAPGAAIDLGELVVSPPNALAGKRIDGTNAMLSLRPGGAVTLRAPFACPLVVSLEKGSATVRMIPLFDTGPAHRVVGFHRAFELAAIPSCDDARGAAVTFSVAGGAPLAEARILDGGTRLAGRTALPPVLSPGISSGIVPVSDAERGATRVDVATRLPDGRVRRRFIEVAASSRASGLANVALQHPVLLRGQELKLTERPTDSRAELRPIGDLLELVPDVTGRFVLEGRANARTVVDSGRYDETPLDCGRSDCHREIAESALTSPMTHAYARDLEGPRAIADPSCALACHTTGEPGLDDGGFAHVAREFGNPPAQSFAELPRDLRRLGGVGCLACHGPGAIPEPTSRFAVLGRGVCAVCHDSPPAYGHVAAFASTRMASADRDPRTLEQPCARCHTTFGALGRLGHRPPPGVELGLGCATCHDVHPSSGDTRAMPSLLRSLPLPDTLGALPASMLGASRVCLSCHAPSSSGAMLPEASAAALLLGRGGTEPSTGTPVTGAAPHGTALDGCLSCHRSGPEGLGRGASHAFAVPADACSSCHTARPRDAALATRARALFERLGGSLPTSPSPPHALAVRPLADPVKARAFANVVLVLEDPAADVHNPRYAALLLDHAEAALTHRSLTSQAP